MNSQQSDVAMAYLQHRVACVVERSLGHSQRTFRDLAEAFGDDPETVRRKLKGHLRMSLEDLIKCILEFGVDVLPPLQDRSELLPPKELLSQ